MEQLYHKIYGEGEPVVILHGLFGMSDNWAGFAKKLSESHMVILIDVRDHGRSPHTESFTYSEAAEDIISLLESSWIYRATFVGHSMGGKIAMQLAEDFPDFVQKLVVIDIAPITYTGGHEKIIKALNSVEIGQAESRKEVEEQLNSALDNIHIVRFLLKNLSRKKDKGFQWKMNLPLLSNAYKKILEQPHLNTIDVPTLFVKGQHSGYIDESGIKEMDKIFSEYELIEIEDAGHWVHADQPKKLYDHLIAFLNRE